MSDMRWQTLDLDGMDEGTRQDWLQALAPLQATIFGETARAQLAAYLFREQACRNRLRLFYADQALVGYQGVHLFETRTRQGEVVAVLRAEAGLLRAYRRHRLTPPLLWIEAVRYKLRHPGRRLVYLSVYVHPSSYRLACDCCREIYPGGGPAMPSDLADLQEQLVDYFDLVRPDAAHPLVIDSGWVVQDSQAERDDWAACPHPAVQRFLRFNPDYGRGRGLLTLIPLHWRNLAGGLWVLLVANWRGGSHGQ